MSGHGLPTPFFFLLPEIDIQCRLRYLGLPLRRRITVISWYQTTLVMAGLPGRNERSNQRSPVPA